jgi:Uma2 family endonuclease
MICPGRSIPDSWTSDRCVVVSSPATSSQCRRLIIADLFRHWSAAVDRDARTTISPFKVMLDDRRYREPDVCLTLGRNAARRERRFWRGADIVVEIISGTNRPQDVITKRAGYAAAKKA